MTSVAASVSDDMDVDAWLDSGKDSGGGSDNKYFKPDFDEEQKVWIQPKAVTKIKNIWRIVWPTLDREGKKLRLIRWNVMEPTDRYRKSFLYKMNFKEDDGSYQHAPTVDPFAFLLQWVNEQIVGGTIDFVDPIFAWEASEGDDKVIHAGGFVGGFTGSKITEENKAKMKAKKIRGDEGYKESCVPKEESVIVVVDNNAPEEGPQIWTVGRGLSKEFQDKIEARTKRFTKKEVEEGKHRLDKFPVCWSVTKDTRNTIPKYVVAETAEEITEELQEAFDQDVPDMSKMFAPSNVALLRESMEAHWVHEGVEPNWDEIFAKAEEAVKGTPAAEAPTSFNYGKNEKKEDKSEDEDEKKEPKTEEKAVEPEGVPCDACGESIPLEVFDSKPVVCPHCKAEYEEKDGEYVLKPKEEKAEKPKIRASRRPK